MRMAFQRAAIGLSFFFSGAAALVYQVVWQRILALQSGVGIYSIAMIVAAFMVGLGLGSELGGRLSLRVGHRGALLVFVALEAGIALFGAASGWFYYDLLYLRAPWLYAVPWRAGLSHFLGLLLPTLLMGMSLPFLSRGMVRDAATASSTVGFLYGVNLFGAGLGALLGPWVLVHKHGILGALLAAAIGNLLAAATALVARSLDRPAPEGMPETPARPPDPRPRHPLGLWMALYAASGFCALSLEMLWFRIIDVAVKSTAFTFGTVLSVYLVGSAIGTMIGVAFARHIERPLRVFLLAQCGITAWAAAWAVALGWLSVDSSFVQTVVSLFAEQQSYDQGNAWTTAGVLKAYLVLPLVLYGVPTVLMGLSFTVLQHAVHDDVRTSGRKVGLLQAANIAGCVAGSLLVGLVALTWWGTTGTLRVLAVAGAAFAVVGLRQYGRRTLFAPATTLLLVLAVVVPPQERLWSRLHGVLDRPVWVEEDATGVIGLSTLGATRWRMWVNGRPHSLLPFGGLHSVLGAAPAIVHPEPREVAVIGLGSGDTAWAAGCRGADTTRVTVFEICAPERRLLVRLAATDDPPVRLREFLADPRIVLRVADGRNALDRDGLRYDVIEMDALHPSSPNSGNLYSEEFLRICAARLAPGGILSTWAPTPRVLATVQKVFPYVLAVSGGQVLLASAQPIDVAPLVWQARLARPDVQAYLGLMPLESLENALADARLVRERRWRRTDYNSDLMPRDEFNVVDDEARDR